MYATAPSRLKPTRSGSAMSLWSNTFADSERDAPQPAWNPRNKNLTARRGANRLGLLAFGAGSESAWKPEPETADHLLSGDPGLSVSEARRLSATPAGNELAACVQALINVAVVIDGVLSGRFASRRCACEVRADWD